MNNKKLTIGLVVVAVIAIIALFTPAGSTIIREGAAVATTNVASFLPSMGLTQLDMSQGCDQSYTCGTTANVPLHTYVTTGSFTFGTTTGAVIPNPFAALGTSTVTVAYVYGTNTNAAITYQLGTSTITTGQSLNQIGSNVSPTLVNIAVPSSSQFYAASGVSVGTALGGSVPVGSGAGTFSSVTVAPSESLVLFATSTVGGASSGAAVAAITTPAAGTSVTYKVEWQR